MAIVMSVNLILEQIVAIGGRVRLHTPRTSSRNTFSVASNNAAAVAKNGTIVPAVARRRQLRVRARSRVAKPGEREEPP